MIIESGQEIKESVLTEGVNLEDFRFEAPRKPMFDYEVLAELNQMMREAQQSASIARDNGQSFNIGAIARRALPTGIEILQRDVWRLQAVGRNASGPLINEHASRLRELRSWLGLAQPLLTEENELREKQLAELEAEISNKKAAPRIITDDMLEKKKRLMQKAK